MTQNRISILSDDCVALSAAKMPRVSFAVPTLFRAATLALTLVLVPAAHAQAPSIESLRANFNNPPDAAKPMVRWWWFGTAVVKPEILRELQQMKADGIQGAELAFVYPEVLDDPAKGLKNLSFLSPEMLDAVNYAQSEGRKLGLRIDVTLCSGWPYGGPATSLAEAAGRLRTVEVAVPANSTSVAVPALKAGESLLSVSIVAGTPTPSARGRSAENPAAPTWNASTAQPLAISGANATTTASDQPRVALFFIASHTGQQVKRAAVGAEGYVLDPFSHDAVATHLRAVGEPLIKAFGSTPPYAIFSDSLEAFGADWTPTLPAEFLKRRGYDLIPHLPELVAGGTPAAETVRHDYGRTLKELVDENYLTQINNWAIAHNTKFRSQTYGHPAVSFSSQSLVGLAEGENPSWRAFSTLRWATSANHVFGHDVSSGETFTWLHSPVFRATPLDMKAEADVDFLSGENLIFCHGWPYSAPPGTVPEPGWSLYAAASFNDHNPWHPVMPAVTRYIARMSYLLRQGQPANQVAILLPTDDAWASFGPARTSLTDIFPKLVTPALMSTILSAGYNVDFIDADAIEKVSLGEHQILVIPPTDRIPVETLAKLAAFTAAGGKVVAVGRAPSIDPEGKPLAKSFAATLPQAAFVPDEAHLTTALHTAAKPDFQISGADAATRNQLGFIRRKLANADVYFVTNTGNTPVDFAATFATAHSSAEQWETDSAAANSATATSQPIHLAPYESRVFVFADSVASTKPAPVPTKPLADLSANWQVAFPALNKSVSEITLTDWIADPSTIHYSGEAVYTREFTLAAVPTTPVFLEVAGGQPSVELGSDGKPISPALRNNPGMHAYYDAPIREAALVTINGQSVGALWHPPYRLDVSQFLKPGANHIEIRVYNTALNAWSALPPHDYKPLIAKYGDRFQMQDLDRVAPITSGLLGSIHLVTTEAK